jgi:hypothetical protein
VVDIRGHNAFLQLLHNFFTTFTGLFGWQKNKTVITEMQDFLLEKHATKKANEYKDRNQGAFDNPTKRRICFRGLV